MSESGRKIKLGEAHSESVHTAETKPSSNDLEAAALSGMNGRSCGNVGHVTIDASNRKLSEEEKSVSPSPPKGREEKKPQSPPPDERDGFKQKSIILKAIDRAENETDLFDIDSAEEKPHAFSAEYEARKQEMLQQAFGNPDAGSTKKEPIHPVKFKKHPTFSFKKAAAVIIAAVFLCVIGFGNIGGFALAMPEPIRQLMMAVQEQFSSSTTVEDVLFGNNKYKDYPGKIETKYEPEMYIDGFNKKEELDFVRYHKIFYENGEGIQYSFQQYTVEQWNNYNTEDITFSEVDINGKTGILYTQNNSWHVVWCNYGYVFDTLGPVDVNELQTIAASIKEVK